MKVARRAQDTLKYRLVMHPTLDVRARISTNHHGSPAFPLWHLATALGGKDPAAAVGAVGELEQVLTRSADLLEQMSGRMTSLTRR